MRPKIHKHYAGGCVDLLKSVKNVIGGQNDIILGCIAYIFNRAADNFKANLLKGSDSGVVR